MVNMATATIPAAQRGDAHRVVEYAVAMSRSSEVREFDPVVVPIVEEFEISMSEWLAGLRGDDEPVVLPVSTAELLADTRAES